jgi:polysaccharide biosynthesis/export protein
MNFSTFVLLGAGLVFAGGQPQDAQKGAAPASPNQKDSNNAPAAHDSRVANNDTDYKIGPQDVLRIDVWKEPDISRVVPVRPDGKISLPLLNDVQAAGLTAMQLAEVLSEGFKKFLNNPQVTVSVSEINSRRVYVNGEVTKPGAMPLQPNMTVLQALSTSGGFTQFARIKNIYILRVTDGKQEKLPFNHKEVAGGHQPDMMLKPGDVIVVP